MERFRKHIPLLKKPAQNLVTMVVNDAQDLVHNALEAWMISSKMTRIVAKIQKDDRKDHSLGSQMVEEMSCPIKQTYEKEKSSGAGKETKTIKQMKKRSQN